jgi:hypothetical protein
MQPSLGQLQCMQKANRGERETRWKIDFTLEQPNRGKKVLQFDAYIRFDAKAMKYYSFHACCHAEGGAAHWFVFCLLFCTSLADKKRTPHWSSLRFACMRIKWCLRGLTHAARFDANTGDALIMHRLQISNLGTRNMIHILTKFGKSIMIYIATKSASARSNSCPARLEHTSVIKEHKGSQHACRYIPRECYSFLKPLST